MTILKVLRSATQIAVALLFLLTFSSRVQAQAISEVAETFAILRDGVPPTLSGLAYEQAKFHLLAEAKDFVEVWEHSQTDENPRCQRFSKAVSGLTEALLSNLNELVEVGSLAMKARFHLLVPALLSLHSMYSNGVEGGYSSLDSNVHTECAYADENVIRQKFDKFMSTLSQFHLNAIGNPGLLGLDEMVTELLASAEEQEQHRQRMSLTLLGAATLASIVLWEVAPLIAVKVATVGGYTGGTTLGPWAAFGARSFAFAAESGVYQFAEAKLNPVPRQRQTNKTASWEEQIRDIELLSLEDRSAEVEIAFLIQVQTQMMQMFRPWFEKNLKENPDALNSLDWKRTLGIAKEAYVLSNATIPQLPSRLADLIREGYGYQVDCASSWWSGLSDIQCVRGMRAVARALYGDKTRSLEPSEGAVFHVNLASGTQPNTHFEPTLITAEIPYNFKPEIMSDVISATLIDPYFQHTVLAVQRFEAYKENVFLNLRIELEFDPNLSLADRWRALKQLEFLMRRDPAVFERATDSFQIGHWFQILHESGMKLKEGISYTANWQQMREFLLRSQAMVNESGFLEQLAKDRAQIQILQQDLNAQFGISAECSPFAELSSQSCLRSLIRLNHYMQLLPQSVLRVPQVMITAPSESNRAEEIHGDPKVLALRTDFNYSSIESYLMEKRN